MDRSNSPQGRKSQGRIKINLEASEKLSILFPQQSNTSLVSSSAEHVANEKGEANGEHGDRTSTTEANYNNTCGEVNSLPKILITPAANDNEAERNGIAITSANSNVKTNSPPTIKPPLLPTSRLCLPQRIRSASLQRTPSAIIRSRPRPIGAEYQLSTNGPSDVQNGGKETTEQPKSKLIALDERKPASTESSTSAENLTASQETPTPLAEDANGKDVPLPSPSTTNDVSSTESIL